MKKIFLLFGLIVATASAPASTGVQLRLDPDQKIIPTRGDDEVVLRIGIVGDSGTSRKRAPLNVCVVLDRSGSMQGAKLEKAKAGAIQVVEHLSSDDFFSLVAYDSKVEVLIPPRQAIDKERIEGRIQRIQTGGGTALYAAVERGGDLLGDDNRSKRLPRIILLSDGLANVGPSSPAEINSLGRRLARQGIPVTTIGVGDDFSEEVMSGLAEASDANYYYVKDVEKLPDIFSRELGELLALRGTDIRVDIQCPRGVRPMGFLGRPEKFENGHCVVRLNSVASGQSRYLFLRCKPEEREARELAEIQLSYRSPEDDSIVERKSEVARIEFSNDPARLQDGRNSEVIAQRDLMRSAEAKDEAIRLADRRDYDAARDCLNQQMRSLQSSGASAPKAMQAEIEVEIRNLKTQADKLERGHYGAGERKQLQSESWNYRNSKQSY
jgi:Ca-activated chloride channel family protein